ncbi:mitochondrial genome maintenance protein mgm101 [Exophiala xenobiotica]|uniref:Mitochondrial genome maintenance protein MGM101 n=1 Tax=Exophiala xenobiotica TaxID=348802 RepID=A0A0D2BTZ4_9EURO|nr:mitochondrial genome maintenance protein mgm101 [Exophiala xenobiotica]KIW55941.1 mitochondrial genome maintenance protein mgm101 [Exophiala xenobiotica]
MLPISRLPLQAPRLRATTFRVLRTDLARSSTYIASPQLKLCRNSYSFRTIFTKSSPRGAEPASTATQPSKPNATSSPPSSETLPAPPTAQAFAVQDDDPSNVDWTRSFHGLSAEPFSKEAAGILMEPLSPDDVEIKPDGIVYLPEIKYRRILNRAFGPGGWGLAPRGETIVTEKAVTREYALLAHGRLVSIARGEQDYFHKDGIPTASEGCKSNAMMRCCKDLGVASELWDPRFIRKWKTEHAREVFVEHQGTKKRTKIWLRKGDPVSYPYAELKR